MPDPINHKELLIAKIKASNPEAEINDDNIFEHLHHYDEENTGRYGVLEKSTKDFTDLIGGNEYASGFIAHLGAGGHPLDYIIDNWDGDIQELLNDPERKDKFEAKMAAKRAAMTAAETEGQSRQTSMHESLDRLVKKLDPTINLEILNGDDEEAKKPEMEKLDAIDEQVQKVIDFLEAIASGFVSGTLSDDMLDLAIKACNYDSDMKTAEEKAAEEAEAAEIKGKNTAVDAKLKKIVGTGGEETNLPPNIKGQSQRATAQQPKEKLNAAPPILM